MPGNFLPIHWPYETVEIIACPSCRANENQHARVIWQLPKTGFSMDTYIMLCCSKCHHAWKLDKNVDICLNGNRYVDGKSVSKRGDTNSSVNPVPSDL